jgi:anti-anti-sigma factor
MGIDFKLTKEYPEGKPKLALFHVGGWLDAQSERRLVEAVQRAKDEGAQYVLLELSGMDTITSAGIRAIQQAYRLLTPKDDASKIVRLKLCNAPPQIYQILSMTGLLINVPTYEGIDIAIDSFGI